MKNSRKMKKLIPIMLLCCGLFACENSTAGQDAGQSHAEEITEEQVPGGEEEESEEVALPDVDAVGNFGAALSDVAAISGKDLLGKLKKSDSVHVKLKGEINSCCQAKGCWMKMTLADNKEMMVKFKDYGFFVPRNSAGKPATIEGWAYRELVSVDELRHYAQDAGESEEEINKITQPEERITFMADGVLIEPSAEGAH